jgi:cytochrome c oxidase subunit 2
MNDVPDAAAPAFALMEHSASSLAPRTDALFIALLALCGAVALGIAVLIVWFSVRYREGSGADRRDPPSRAPALEASWTIAPLLLFAGVFAWGARDYALAQRTPPDALPVYVVAKQWMWKLQHGNGRQEINELHVPLNRPVVLVLASQDVIHSFFVPAFRLKQDVLPGRYTRLWFTATRLGDYRILCAEYCGSAHSSMLGHVVVMPAADYARWLDEQPAPRDAGVAAADDTPARRGAALYGRLGCGGCHDAGSSVGAPALAGLYGTRVALADGSTVRADDDYLRESIVAPRRRVVRGQPALMPSYAGQLDEAALVDLVAYLRSLGAQPRGAAPASASTPSSASAAP